MMRQPLLEKIRGLINVLDRYINQRRERSLEIVCDARQIMINIWDDEGMENILNICFEDTEEEVFRLFVLAVIWMTFERRIYVSDNGELINPFTNPKIKIVIDDARLFEELKDDLVVEPVFREMILKQMGFRFRVRHQRKLVKHVQALTDVVSEVLQ